MVGPALDLRDWSESCCVELVAAAGARPGESCSSSVNYRDPNCNFYTLLEIVQKYLEGSRAQPTRSEREGRGFLKHHIWSNVSKFASKMIVGFIYYNDCKVNPEFLRKVIKGGGKDTKLVSKKEYEDFIHCPNYWETNFLGCKDFVETDFLEWLEGTNNFIESHMTHSTFDQITDYSHVKVCEPSNAIAAGYFPRNKNDEGAENEGIDEENKGNESDSSGIVVLSSNVDDNQKRVNGDVSSANILVSKRKRSKTQRLGANTSVDSSIYNRAGKRSRSVANGSKSSSTTNKRAKRGKDIVEDDENDSGNNSHIDNKHNDDNNNDDDDDVDIDSCDMDGDDDSVDGSDNVGSGSGDSIVSGGNSASNVSSIVNDNVSSSIDNIVSDSASSSSDNIVSNNIVSNSTSSSSDNIVSNNIVSDNIVSNNIVGDNPNSSSNRVGTGSGVSEEAYRRDTKNFALTTFYRRLEQIQSQQFLAYEEMNKLADICVALDDKSSTISDIRGALQDYYNKTNVLVANLVADEKLGRINILRDLIIEKMFPRSPSLI